MSPLTISETRDGRLPIPYIDEPVGMLEYDGHIIDVWSIATTADGKVIYLNCSGADASVSAALKRLLRKDSGYARFQPTPAVTWSGPTSLYRLADHYDTITQALTHQGMRLKNTCVIPDCVNIALGLSRPLERQDALALSSHPEEEEGEEPTEEAPDGGEPETSVPGVKTCASSFRYVLGDAASDRPPPGALFAHLQSLGIVCHPDWEQSLWGHGKAQGLIQPQPALGIHAWSITRERPRWTELVGALWMAGVLARPETTSLLPARTRRSHRHVSARK